MAATTQGKVLILDSDAERTADLSTRLRYLNYEPVALGDTDDADPDSIAVLLGDVGPDTGHADILAALKKRQPDLPLLCMSGCGVPEGPGDTGSVAWSLKLPLRKSQLKRLLDRAARYHGKERRHRLTGSSMPIRRVRGLIEQVADFDTNVLVTGQSGTGKELVARTIHDLSPRADKPFVPINCGAIPVDLLESELFGHKKGAFTGAVSDRTGRFELAEGGTLFLDEIGDMSLDMQVKLLRVLQEHTYERVGGGRSRRSDVRIIAATHRDLPAAVESGEFRADLYYRLNVFPIEMPPLYKRTSDLPQLLDELLIRHTGERAGELRVSAPAMAVLAGYSWPGNIRELSNLVERLAIIKPEGTIEVDDLPPKYREAAASGAAAPNMVAEAMQMTAANMKQHLQCLEKMLIEQAMAAADGVVARAAELLRVRRTTLVEKIRKLDVH